MSRNFNFSDYLFASLGAKPSDLDTMAFGQLDNLLYGIADCPAKVSAPTNAVDDASRGHAATGQGIPQPGAVCGPHP